MQKDCTQLLNAIGKKFSEIYVEVKKTEKDKSKAMQKSVKLLKNQFN
jgi:hypothetical protein